VLSDSGGLIEMEHDLVIMACRCRMGEVVMSAQEIESCMCCEVDGENNKVSPSSAAHLIRAKV